MYSLFNCRCDKQTPEATFRNKMGKMKMMKNGMSNMKDCVDEIETNMHDHEIHSTKRNEVVDQMLNEINYSVLEINSLAVFFAKTTDNERIRQSLAGATQNIEGDGNIAENGNDEYLDFLDQQNQNQKETYMEQTDQNSQPQAGLRRKSNNSFTKKNKLFSIK